ncbi:MAG: methyltransferase domain-containing protein [Clostridia bacterium]|nr:methyltransferase domain-containing protein [Clostridia bacterium]NCD01757.1 methyltransferase domain-containing protein [Clostridia bacterium]
MIKKICEEIYAGINVRENLIELNQMIKDEGFLDSFLDEYYENEAKFKELLDSEDSKIRKNIVKLLGRVADPELKDDIFRHYQAETTQFLKSDYLSALASFDYKEYLPELKKRWYELGEQERTKHSVEELKQLKLLIWKVEPPKRHTFDGYDMENKVLLIVSRGHEDTVLEEVKKIPDTTGKVMPGGCMVSTKRLEEVSRIRLFQAILFDFCPSMIPSYEGTAIGEKIIQAGIVEYIQKRHKEISPFLFRVEVKGVKDIAQKNRIAKDLSKYLEEHSKGMLVNEPSFYELEIRVIVGKSGSRVFLKLTCMPDTRFAYRKYATSTSMQPTKAALMMHYIQPYLRADSNILDPFCGTGTLLIERAKIMDFRSIYGLDISGQAVQAAWENSQRADVMLHLVQRSFNDFTHEYAFDEILTDMPRRSDNRPQKQIEYLYHILFNKSHELLAPKGILVVYSEDKRMMESELEEASWAKLLNKYPMGRDDASWIYVIENTEE